MEGLAGFAWADLSAGALLALVVLFIVLGRLIPKAQLERELADKNSQIVHLRELANELASQNAALIDAARSGTSAAAALQRIVQEAE